MLREVVLPMVSPREPDPVALHCSSPTQRRGVEGKRLGAPGGAREEAATPPGVLDPVFSNCVRLCWPWALAFHEVKRSQWKALQIWEPKGESPHGKCSLVVRW